MAKVKKQNKRKAKTVDEEEKQNKRKAKTVDEEEKKNKGKAKTVDEVDEPEVKDKKEVTPSGKRRKEPEKKDDSEANWDLGPAKKCTVRTFKEKVLIDIREVRSHSSFVDLIQNSNNNHCASPTLLIVLRKGWQTTSREERNFSYCRTIQRF